MNELTKPEQAGLLSLLRQDTVLPDVSDPYSREILLIETQVAGTTHVLGIEIVRTMRTAGADYPDCASGLCPLRKVSIFITDAK
ncbi:MAG: hypothetical protein II769_05455 [Oscillospiraceae bacterium]|nr:hypothetical protein [Oscillospiraceae bacterium]